MHPSHTDSHTLLAPHLTQNLDEDEIVYMSSASSSGNDIELKIDDLSKDDAAENDAEDSKKDTLSVKNSVSNPGPPRLALTASRQTVSFSSLASEVPPLYPTVSKKDEDEQQSDFLDSLHLLNISLNQEIALLEAYFPRTRIECLLNDSIFAQMDNQNNNLNDDHQLIKITYFDSSCDDPMQIEQNAIQMTFKCSRGYPDEEHSCICRSVECPAFSNQEIVALRYRLNFIAQEHCKQNHNALLMIMIYLDNRLSSISKKAAMLASEFDTMPRSSSENSLSNHSSNVGNIGNIPENGFFDSLQSLHNNDDSAPVVKSKVMLNVNQTNPNKLSHDSNSNKHKEQILPSSFNSFQDILTSKTRDERKAEEKYASIDENILCPKMCGAIWAKNGQLIFFNNLLRKTPKNGKKVEIQQERDKIKTFQDYNKFIEKCGANHSHSMELRSIRKRVFANHLDEDDDRFPDEFVVGFALSECQSLQHNASTLMTNGRKSKSHPYRNAYLHRSLSYLHHQHHHQNALHPNQRHYYLRGGGYDPKTSQHHVMPHLTLPLSVDQTYNLQHSQQPEKAINQNVKTSKTVHEKHRTRHRHDRKKKYRLLNATPTRHRQHRRSFHREGNARIFCPGIIAFPFRTYCVKLVSNCKLTANEELNVPELCMYNANVCRKLGLYRLSRVLRTLSTFLLTASSSNALIPSPYHHNYIAKFVKKAVDELYFNNEIQGIAIIACLLRQSQYFALLFYDANLDNELVMDTNCGYLLQSCVAQYLRVLKHRMEDEEISDLEQLQNFSYLLKKQKEMLQMNRKI